MTTRLGDEISVADGQAAREPFRRPQLDSSGIVSRVFFRRRGSPLGRRQTHEVGHEARRGSHPHVLTPAPSLLVERTSRHGRKRRISANH
jgi:hypothetical protein